MVVFEVPTGVVADTRGRRISYLLGTLTLAVSTVLYLLMWRVPRPSGPGRWRPPSSGSASRSSRERRGVAGRCADGQRIRAEPLESVLAKGKIVEGVAMLGGSVAGGLIAQAHEPRRPLHLRALVLALSFVFGFVLMRDTGFTPEAEQATGEGEEEVPARRHPHGLGNPPVRWIMLAAPFTRRCQHLRLLRDAALPAWSSTATSGVSPWPDWPRPSSAGAQIAGGLLVPHSAACSAGARP